MRRARHWLIYNYHAPCCDDSLASGTRSLHTHPAVSANESRKEDSHAYGKTESYTDLELATYLAGVP